MAAMNAMTARRLSPDDVTEYRNLRLACIEENPAAVWASYAEEIAVPLDQMRQRLAHAPYQAVFGAFDDGKLVAMAGFKRAAVAKIHHRGEIWGVYVVPGARGMGVSRKLLEALLDHARTIPEVIVVTLSVRTTNDAARALYRKLGFTVTGVDRRSIFADGAYHDEERMRLDLDAA
jgi:ribosomal protein S18 acetylase RimI-like enzyme